MMDLMVSISVMALLIAMLLPSLGAVRETTRRVICSSNQRQLGLAIAMYADANKDNVPWTMFMGATQLANGSMKIMNEPQHTMTIRVGTDFGQPSPRLGWDGLGGLARDQYIRVPDVFYCPSHKGLHPIDRYRPQWGNDSMTMTCNFQFRAVAPSKERTLPAMAGIALLADGFKTLDDFNHASGTNVLMGDLSHFWFPDGQGTFKASLPDVDLKATPTKMAQGWEALDKASKDR